MRVTFPQNGPSGFGITVTEVTVLPSGMVISPLADLIVSAWAMLAKNRTASATTSSSFMVLLPTCPSNTHPLLGSRRACFLADGLQLLWMEVVRFYRRCNDNLKRESPPLNHDLDNRLLALRAIATR